MSALPRTYSAQLRNLALTQSGRVRKSSSSLISKPNVRSQDLESFGFSYWLGVSFLLRGQPCVPGVVGCFKQLLQNCLESADLLGFIEACSSIRQVLVTTGYWDNDLLRSIKLRWVRGVVHAISLAIRPTLIVHPSPIFNAVVTFLGWLKRVPVCIRPQHEAVDAYYENDRRISSINFEDRVDLPALRDIWWEWLKDFKLSPPFIAKHGSGSTADRGRVRARKWSNLSLDLAARVCLRYPNLERCIDLPCGAPKRVAKVVFVPKQAGKDRTICMEPAWLQFLQQGVANQLMRYIHHGSHSLSGYINLYSQDVNRDLCAMAYSHGYSTIDLSDASDSVSWRLIRYLCKGMPIYRYLFATRSTSAIVAGVESVFDKFAPMGSALCFPIECILFASIVELAYRTHYGQASRGHLSGCSVYGDDIICPSEIYHLVVGLLNHLGFKVNTSKSSHGGGYFESCGVEYLYGAKIMTIKHPRNHLTCGDVVSPDRVGLVTDLANTLLSCGYLEARRTLLKYYEGKRIRVNHRIQPFMDFVSFDSGHCVPVIEPYNTGTWNVDLQCLGVTRKSIVTSSLKSRYDWDEYHSRTLPSLREDRLRVNSLPKPVNPKWSLKAVTFLSKHHFWSLLEKGSVEDVGACRTGRTHQRISRSFVPLGFPLV